MDGPRMNGHDNILVEHDATGIVTVTLNNPARRNAMSFAMWQGLGETYSALGKRSDVRVVILTGAGGNFCAGADISEFSKVRNTEASAKVYNQAGEFATHAIIDLPQPTIAAVNGYGVGGGCGLALACDLRVGDASTQMGIPAARLSIVYSTLDCDLLLRAVGLANAKLVLYSGRYFKLAECQAMGLVDIVSPDGALVGAKALAAEFATRAPLSQRGAKVVLEALARGETGRRANEIDAAQAAAVNSQDYREAARAFLEKRTPAFTGH
jgi:enoyl-CoA hydratase/carnithine racemase